MPTFADKVTQYTAPPNVPNEINHAIIIGSHARGEVGGPQLEVNIETFFFNLTERIIYEGSPDNITYSHYIDQLETPEMVLEAWSNHPHLNEVLSRVKMYLAYKNPTSTLKYLDRRAKYFTNILENGLMNMGGKVNTQFYKNSNNEITFLINPDEMQYGPKYSILRLFQIYTLAAVIKFEDANSLQTFFNVNFHIHPSISNRIAFFKEHLPSTDILKVNILNKIMHDYYFFVTQYNLGKTFSIDSEMFNRVNQEINFLEGIVRTGNI